jgi:hypothetical protein
MLPLDDPKWDELMGGYGVPYDPSDALRRLENGEDVWDELWEELHHQGDVGEASYATIPHLVRIGKSLPCRDWNFYGLISTIEVERHRKSNPPLPNWLAQPYIEAMRGLLEVALSDLGSVEDRLTIRSILGAIALAKGDLKLGALISNSDATEIDESLERSHVWSELYSDQTSKREQKRRSKGPEK